MAITAPTLVGTPPTSKASGTTLTQSSVALNEGDTLIVAIAYDNAQGAPTSIKWGNRELGELTATRQANVGTGMTVSMWRLRYVHMPGTRDVVATWSSAILERTLQCIQIKGAAVTDVTSTAQQDASTTPATGGAVTTTNADTLHIAAFAAQGPTNDTAATANLGHTLLGRSGTAGTPPVSNVTLQTTYEILTATGDARGTLTLTTARDCAGSIVALEPRQTFTIKACEQRHRNRNHLPDSVWTKMEDEENKGFWFELDPDIFDAMSDTEYYDYCRKICAIWTSNILDDELVWDEDSARDTRMSGMVNDTVGL